MEEINPDALAEWPEEDEYASEEAIRPGVQRVGPDMIFHYVMKTGELPLTESARAFADWLNHVWHDFVDGQDITIGKVIEGALEDWRGGK